jgi:hypothetical protein
MVWKNNDVILRVWLFFPQNIFYSNQLKYEITFTFPRDFGNWNFSGFIFISNFLVRSW